MKLMAHTLTGEMHKGMTASTNHGNLDTMKAIVRGEHYFLHCINHKLIKSENHTICIINLYYVAKIWK